MPFDIREHIESLNSLGRGRYNCPVCGSKSFTINKKTGAYRCHANECANADIRQAIAPIEPGASITDYGNKPKTPPKPKAKPVLITNAADCELGKLPEDRQHPKKIKLSGGTKVFYDYGNGHKVERTDKKNGKTIYPMFRSDPADNGEGYTKGKGDRPWDAYRIDEALKFAAGKWVVLVEGEKCVEAMRSIGIPSITFNGSGWKNDDFSRAIVRLKGSCEGLVVIPDNDEPGQKKAAEFLEACASHSYPCLILNPLHLCKDLGDGGDVADWVVMARGQKQSEFKMRADLDLVIFNTVSAQLPEDAPAPVIAETTKPLTPHIPETRRIHGGYKELKVVELFEFVSEYLGDRLSFDDLTCEVLLDDEPLKFGHDLKFWFFHQFGESASREDIYACLLYHAKMNSFNPVARYLDRVHKAPERIDISNISSRYFGTTDPIYDRMVRMWLISAVARAFDPGCQVDHTLILQSSQGKYKSTWFKALGGDWFSDSVKDIENKDSLLTMHSSWIIELSELDRITSKKQAGIIKHFLTQREDTFRKPYAKEVERNHRRALFCGTVNPSRFLVDSENRRFWIIPVADTVTEVNIPLVQSERDGIWAAAVEAYRSGEAWYPTDEEKQAIAEMSKEFLDQDVWLEPIEEYLSDRPWVSVFEILFDLFNLKTSEMDRRSEMRVAKILDQMGWTKSTRKTIHGKLRRVRLNPTWNEPEAKYFTDNAIDNTINNTLVKVGKVGKSADMQSFHYDQPTDQPIDEVGHDKGWIDPTSVNGVGQPQTHTQQAINQPTNLHTPIPQKYSDKGFTYGIGDQVYLENTNLFLTIKAFPPAGIQFSRKEYLCVDAHGNEEWIKQSELVKA